MKIVRRNISGTKPKGKKNTQANTVAKKPKRRASRLYKLPRRGELFKSEHMPPVAKEFYKRLSQIYGIPLKDLLPKFAELPPLLYDALLVAGYYDSLKHEMNVHTIFKVLLKGKAPKGVLEEELLHSGQMLLTEAEYTRFERKYMKKLSEQKEKERKRLQALKLFRQKPFVEATAKAYEKPLSAAYKAAIAPFVLYVILRAYPAVAISLSASWAALRAYRRFVSRGYYKRHGVDGLIILFTDPPKKWQLKNLSAKEKEFIEKGYLKERGGLTKKGMQFIRERIPRQVLIENVRFLRSKRR